MKAIGITCGIGSMLVGARNAGFDVVGNVEWRGYYHAKDADGRNTFTENFKGAKFHRKIEQMTIEEIAAFMGADIALGHPECGKYSTLSASSPDVSGDDPSDIPLFVDLVDKFRPRFFVMDDLPKSFRAFTMKDYADRLPDYDLFPEWVSNYGYGNVQKNRNRLFMIGALKTERWAFVPGEEENERTVRDVIGDIEHQVGKLPNHDRHVLDDVCRRGKSLETMGRDQIPTYRDMRAYFESVPEGYIMKYIGADGQRKVRMGYAKAYWDAHMFVMTGTNPAVHPRRCTPLTIRERARLQGFPDDFVFYGIRLNEKGEFDHDRNSTLVKQTGKAMPVQFCEYVSRQVAAHLKGEPWSASGRRTIEPNRYVTFSKEWYCENVGYSDQAKACGQCWLSQACRIRHEKYGIGPPIEQPSLPMKVPTTVFAPPREPRAPRAAKPPRAVRRFADYGSAAQDITFDEGDD